ncbi:MAG: tryptophan synthase subunit alpha [Polyangiaceae bacterium]|nr:tryptophan synthase subunit alpha [Polyangiaceae bacterium]
MSRLRERFERLRAGRRKALVAYLCVGDPSLDESVALAQAAVRAGADVLELGVPFSDPVADGPVIARAAERALAAGATLPGVLEVARRLRAETDVPLVLFTYANPLLVRTLPRVVAAAREASIDALLVVDLPTEAAGELRLLAAQAGIDVVPLIAPTSTEARARAALSVATGFAYYVSVTGITGSATAPLEAASREAARLSAEHGVPVVVGFGVDSPDKARRAAGPAEGGADGVVVGTAIVKAIEGARSPAEAERAVFDLVKGLRDALDAP